MSAATAGSISRSTGEPFMVEYGRFPRGLAVSPDGRTFALTQADGTVDLVDVERCDRAQPPRDPRRSRGASFSPDGRLLAVTGAKGALTLWDARTLRSAGELEG